MIRDIRLCSPEWYRQAHFWVLAHALLGENGGTKKCNYRLLFINVHSPNRHPVQNSKE